MLWRAERTEEFNRSDAASAPTFLSWEWSTARTCAPSLAVDRKRCFSTSQADNSSSKPPTLIHQAFMRMATSIQIEQKEPLLNDDGHPSASSAPAVPTMALKIGSASFYALASFLITIVNKSVLTSYGFPSFQALALGQMVTTIVVLYVGKHIGVVSFPDLDLATFRRLGPLPFIYAANVVFGLGGTKELSLPMFTMLRRFSILMTMIAEFWVLGVRPKLPVKISVGLMIVGAIVAASTDLGFNLHGYVFVLLSDVLTASNGVFTKQILSAPVGGAASSTPPLGKYGVMFYCAFFMTPVAFGALCLSGDVARVEEFTLWSDPFFLIQFFGSCCMGFILNYSVVLCTQHNSALTTTIMGCLKNILVTYLGMFIGGDYIFSMPNFVGINLSVIGSLLYTYVTFKPTKGPGPSVSKTLRKI
ncbi:UDP-sugar transporter [Nesidiocoris tenuis]|uniref:UDP-sugar transporter n=1 Tax=Nesidiocoris tenuis TaxID=355587 RepID=A0ABN7B7C4_9HEMI|nr:UDP-sugar transporter [Nesidiocoris tenuis]